MPLLSLALSNLLLVGCVSKAEASGDDDIADLAASLAATQAELAELRSSVDCFVGHMTDNTYIRMMYSDPNDPEDLEDCERYNGVWLEGYGCLATFSEGGLDAEEWSEGPGYGSSALYAYDDCF